MRLLSTSLLLSVLAIAASCSQGNYAQVEPDDLYFTHKDRKAANTNYMATASTNSSYDYNDRDVSNYTNQHSPTITSTSLGSPTIQSTTGVFYDANQNPDYVSAQANPSAETSSEYYVENYDLPLTETETVVPQTTVNNYYGANPYNSNFSPWSSFFTLSFGYGIGSYYNPYTDPFSPYYNPFYSSRWMYDQYGSSSYYGYNNPWYSSNYGGGYPNYGFGSYCYYPVSYSGNSNSYNTDNASYRDGTSIITSPRRSRSTVSNYTGSQVVSRKRTSYDADGNSGGRISNDTKTTRQVANTVPAERQINPYKNNGTDESRRAKYGDMNSSSPTIQSNNVRRKINTTLERQRSRSNSGVVNSPSYRGNSSYNSNGSRNNSYTPSKGGQKSSYSKPRSNSSYKPSRSNSSSRPSYTPSRSSSTPRSTPSRSSGSSTKSSSSSSRKRN